MIDNSILSPEQYQNLFNQIKTEELENFKEKKKTADQMQQSIQSLIENFLKQELFHANRKNSP